MKKISPATCLKSLKMFFAKHWRKWTICAFLAILIYVGFIAYKYVYLTLYGQREVVPFKLEIKKNIYREIMDSLNQEEKINQIFSKEYLDPFK